MGGNYQKGLYDQLMEVMARVDNLEFQHKEDHRVIDGLKNDVAHLENLNAILEDKAAFLSEENASLNIFTPIMLSRINASHGAILLIMNSSLDPSRYPMNGIRP